MFSSVQSLSHVRLFATSWIAACQASLSISISWSLLKLMSIESGMPSSHLILCHLLLLLAPIPSASGSFPVSQLFTWGCQSIGVSASASVLPMNTQDWCPLKNKMLLFATIWMELEDIILDEISERKWNTVMFSLYGESKNQNEWTNKQKHTHRLGE